MEEYIKLIPNPCNCAEALENLCCYITDPVKTKGYIGGRGLSPKTAYEDMAELQALFQTDYGRRAYHLIVSFPDTIVLSPYELTEIAERVSELFFPNYQVLYGVHVTQAHPHFHMAVNTTSIQDGKKLHITFSEFSALQKQISRIVQDYNSETL